MQPKDAYQKVASLSPRKHEYSSYKDKVKESCDKLASALGIQTQATANPSSLNFSNGKNNSRYEQNNDDCLFNS